MTALAADGAIEWSFAPTDGIAGDAVIAGGAVYAASSNGTLYAVSISDGSPIWQREAAGATAIDSDAILIYAMHTHGITAFDLAGARVWSIAGFSAQAVTPAISPHGTIFIATDGGHLAAIGPHGALSWIAGAFGPVEALTFGTGADSLYVIGKDGNCWSVKEIADSE